MLNTQNFAQNRFVDRNDLLFLSNSMYYKYFDLLLTSIFIIKCVKRHSRHILLTIVLLYNIDKAIQLLFKYFQGLFLRYL